MHLFVHRSSGYQIRPIKSIILGDECQYARQFQRDFIARETEKTTRFTVGFISE